MGNTQSGSAAPTGESFLLLFFKKEVLLFLSKISGRMLLIIPVIFIPLLIAAIGIMVFVRRRAS